MKLKQTILIPLFAATTFLIAQGALATTFKVAVGDAQGSDLA